MRLAVLPIGMCVCGLERVQGLVRVHVNCVSISSLCIMQSDPSSLIAVLETRNLLPPVCLHMASLSIGTVSVAALCALPIFLMYFSDMVTALLLCNAPQAGIDEKLNDQLV